MADFKVIETQEEFDVAISDRLKRDRAKYTEQFEKEMREKGWKSADEVAELTSDLNKQIETLQNAAASTEQIIAQKDVEIAKGETYRADLEKTRIALAAGLGIEQAARIRGDNAEEWAADAKKLAAEFASFAAANNAPAPLGDPGVSAGKSTREQFADFASEIFSH